MWYDHQDYHAVLYFYNTECTTVQMNKYCVKYHGGGGHIIINIILIIFYSDDNDYRFRPRQRFLDICICIYNIYTVGGFQMRAYFFFYYNI